MAREVIQNSWDASNDLRAQLDAAGLEHPGFSIEFRFEDHVGPAKEELVAAMDLNGLHGHLGGSANRQKLGLATSDCLDRLHDDTPIRTLQIVESGASGMYGRFEGSQSKMFLALISLGYTVKQDGAGGSYGFGKAGLIRGSKVHSLVAYTCFRERDDEPGVTRRLLGMTYWGQHELEEESYTGFARLGEMVDGEWAKPFENDAADEAASVLGMERRSADVATETGSSFLLLDPAVTAEELGHAVERNWWPALIDRDFSVKIVDADGTESFPRPRKNKDLEPFIRGYELATTSQDNPVPAEHRQPLGKTNATSPPSEVGTIGLLADLEGWSYAEDVEPIADDDGDEAGRISHRSLVALVRDTKMVIEYADLGSSRPYIRGVFVADSSINEYLRQTEPMAHDAWRTDAREEGIDAEAPKIAKSVHQKIRASVASFRKKLNPPLPQENEIRLPFLQEFFRQVLTGKAPAKSNPPLAENRPIAIRVRERLEIGDTPDRIRLIATVEFALSEHHEADSAECRLKIEYRFLEDGRVGKDRCDLEIKSPAGFEKPPDTAEYVGELTHEFVTFSVRSESYSPDWSGRLVAVGELGGPPDLGTSLPVEASDDE